MTADVIGAVLLGAVSGAGLVYLGLFLPHARASRSAKAAFALALTEWARALPAIILEMDLRPQEPAFASSPQLVGVGEELRSAFESLCSTSFELVREQRLLRVGYADVCVSLARRSENLVQRQLHVIEPLELDEANEAILNELFQLDHLMNRLRRVNANAMVLSGSAGAPVYSAPLEVPDVLYGALAGAEQYQRVTVSTRVGCTVASIVAGDLSALITELVDNAATFSAPDTEVLLTCDLGPFGPLSIDVTDRGLGISEQDLEKLNTCLQTVDARQLVGAKRVGLLVVGRLAGRHGIKVSLHGSSSGQGTVAHVEVPRQHLFQDGVRLDVLTEDKHVDSTLSQGSVSRLPINHFGPALSAAAATDSSHLLTQSARTPEPVPLPNRRNRIPVFAAVGTVAKPAMAVTVAPSDSGPAHDQAKARGGIRPLPEAATVTPDWQLDQSGKSRHQPTAALTAPLSAPGTMNPRSRWFTQQSAHRPGSSASTDQGDGTTETAAILDWGAPAEDGWRIVETGPSLTQPTDPLTGLPVRTRGARLFYGSAPARAGQAHHADVGAAPVLREPLVVRNRLSAYRHGIDHARQDSGRSPALTNNRGGWTVLTDDE